MAGVMGQGKLCAALYARGEDRALGGYVMHYC
jgi:hypothetical protein